MARLAFSWRAPSYPIDGTPARQFVNQLTTYLKETHQLFSAVWFDDHLHCVSNFLPPTTPVLENWTILTYFSAIFTDLDYGGIVLCNSYRNPALLAKMGATLSCLTGGRFMLGIGVGWKQDEYIAYDYPFPSNKERILRLGESVQIIKKMWNESPATFEGKYHSVKSAYCEPKPVNLTPIMIGGGGEKLTLRVVARYADWWNLSAISPETYNRKLRILAEHCSRVGRNMKEIRKTWSGLISIAKTDEEALAKARANPQLDVKLNPWLEEKGYLVGSPKTIKEQLKEFVDLGVEHINLKFIDFPSTEGAKLFGGEVGPSFQ